MKTHHVLLILMVGLAAGIGASFWWPEPAHTPLVGNQTVLVPTSTPSSTVIAEEVSSAKQPDSVVVGENAQSPYARFYQDIAARKEANPSVFGIQFFGDIMLDRNVAKVMGASGTSYLFENILGEGKGLDPRIDLTVANLEGPFAPSRIKTTKSIAFRFDPKFARELKDAGFDAVSLANNHTLDMGWANVDFTHKTLDEAGLPYFGDQLRDTKEFTHVAQVAGQTVAFIGLNNTDHVMDLKKISSIIADAKTRASITIVMMHWGEEYKRISNANQRSFAHFLIDEGVSAVIGAHPHVIEEVELYNGKPIFYSLGNFVFDQYFSEETQEGLSAGLMFQDGEIVSVYAFPFYSVKSKVFMMAGERRDKFYDWLNKNSRIEDKKFEEGELILK